MVSKCEVLRKNVKSAARRREESERKAEEQELEADSQLDKLEVLVDKYNTLAFQVGLIPSTAMHAKGEQHKLVVTVNESIFTNSTVNGLYTVSTATGRLLADPDTGYPPAHVLSLDLRGRIPTFTALCNTIRERRSAVKDATTKDRDLLADIKEAIRGKQSEVGALNDRIRAAKEEYKRANEDTNTQKQRSDARIERIEQELREMRVHLTNSVQIIDLKEMNIEIE